MRAVKDPAPANLIQETSTTKCNRIEANAWVYLLQVYEPDSSTTAKYNALSYYRSDSNVYSTCTTTDCGASCQKTLTEQEKTLIKILGSSFLSFFHYPHEFSVVKNPLQIM